MVDMDIVASPPFVILTLMALGATALGYLLSIRMGFVPMPLWQLIVLMVGETVACYAIVARG